MPELKIINDFYNLLKWYGNLLSKFPRNHRYALGLRIENTLYDILELLIGQKAQPQSPQLLNQASVKLDMLRFFIQHELLGLLLTTLRPDLTPCVE